MSRAQQLEEQDFAACSADRFDGFDRGDLDNDDYGNDDDAECPEYDEPHTHEDAVRVAEHRSCSLEDAHRYLDLKDEGYSTQDALLLAGLADPTDWL